MLCQFDAIGKLWFAFISAPRPIGPTLIVAPTGLPKKNTWRFPKSSGVPQAIIQVDDHETTMVTTGDPQLAGLRSALSKNCVAKRWHSPLAMRKELLRSPGRNGWFSQKTMVLEASKIMKTSDFPNQTLGRLASKMWLQPLVVLWCDDQNLVGFAYRKKPQNKEVSLNICSWAYPRYPAGANPSSPMWLLIGGWFQTHVGLVV